MKKVLITGATGFKGSWLTLWLLNLGAEIYGFSRDENGDNNLFCKLFSNELKEQKISEEFHSWLNSMLGDHKRCMELGKRSKEYVEGQAGASERCLPLLVC